VVHGFATPDPAPSEIRIISREGRKKRFQLDQLKAVFFVKDFQGDPGYAEVKFMAQEPDKSMVWVRVEFVDGEVQEGKVLNSIELLRDPGFYLWPLDRDVNNEMVFVSKSSLKSFTVLHAS
jgi:hypothetical protein